MGVDEGNLQVKDVDVMILENCQITITLRYILLTSSDYGAYISHYTLHL